MLAATRDSLALIVGLTSGFALALALVWRCDASRATAPLRRSLLRLAPPRAYLAARTLVRDALARRLDVGTGDARRGRVAASGRLFYAGLATFCLGLVAMFVGVLAESSCVQFLAVAVLTLGYAATTSSLLFGEAMFRRLSETATSAEAVGD